MMFGLYVISFQVLTIVLFGVFIRIDSTSTESSSLSQSFVLLLGYTLISIRYRLYDWTTLTNLIFISAITFQWNTLFYIFWTSCVNSSFSATANITSDVVVASVQAILCILVTLNVFLGRLTHLQMFVIALIEIIGFSLNVAIENKKINAVLGGGGVTIFLFAATFAFCIKLLNYKTLKSTEDFSYNSGVFKIIGLVLLVFAWPSFNQMGATIDSTNVAATANLGPSSYYNTIFALSTGIICSLTLQSYGNRVNLHKFIMNIFNAGVLISTSSGLIIDPFASLLLGIAAPLLALLYQKYGQILYFRGQPQYLLAFSILSGIMSAIFAAGRAARDPTLSDNPYRLGGLQLACLFVTMGFAAVFGLLTALVLKLFKGPKQNEFGQDEGLWIITADMIPLHPDDTFQLTAKKEKEWDKEKVEGQGNVVDDLNNTVRPISLIT